MRKIVIIGNGISGVTCARHIRKLCNDHISIISSETEHFYSRTALMYVYMGHMKFENIKPYENFFWEKNKLNIIHDYVLNVNSADKTLFLKNGAPVTYDILIIASGSSTSKFNWPGQDIKGVEGFYNFHDLQQIQLHTKIISDAVIVGGGLIGVELAEMLHSRKINVTMLVRDKSYWASVVPEQDAKLLGGHIERHGINILYQTELKEIIANKEGILTHIITTAGQVIKCSFVGIATGVKPNIHFLKESGIETNKGILVNKYFETNVSGVYAIGDCAEFNETIPGRKKIEQIWYTGRMHGETLAMTITGKKTAYKPGPFFNSAKFFDLEYQTYGLVPSKSLEDHQLYTWQHPKLEKLLTFYFEKNTNIFKGINCYGTRLRHEVFDKWLYNNVTIDTVISNFKTAIFDKEFEKSYTSLLINDYNAFSGKNLRPVKQSFFSLK